MDTTRFVQVWTSAEADGRIDKLSDILALGLLQEQYGGETGLLFFIGLATGKSKCASVGASMIEFRGTPLSAN